MKAHFRLRNKFILENSVDLFGRSSHWNDFRAPRNFLRKRPPTNFKGDVPHTKEFLLLSVLRLMSKYKVAVCMENSVEGAYFTEKFVNACRCGCIPVYHASATVKRSFLEGALWVDPKDFGYNPKRTIEFAVNQDITAYQQANYRWLQTSTALQTTSYASTTAKIFRLMADKIRCN